MKQSPYQTAPVTSNTAGKKEKAPTSQALIDRDNQGEKPNPAMTVENYSGVTTKEAE